MAEYIDRTELEPDTEWSEYADDFISYSQSQINSSPAADVIERAKIDKAIEEIQARADMFHKIGDSNNACTTISALEILKRNVGE